MHKISQSLWVFILLSINLFSQPAYKVRQISDQNGMLRGPVNCILQDHKGFIWIGTEHGLNRYDGYNLKQYLHDPQDPSSISHNHISTIIEDTTDGKYVLWVGTDGGGLNRFDLNRERFNCYMHDPTDSTGITSNRVTCLYRDSAGTIWVGTAGGGLNRLHPETGIIEAYQNNYHDNYSLSNNHVNCITVDSRGYLWVGTGHGLNMADLYAGDQRSIASDVVSTNHNTYHPVGTVWEYDPKPSNPTWTARTGMPTPRWMAGSTVFDDKIYIIGGIGHPPPSDTPAMAMLEIYDPANDRWDRGTDMRVPRAALSVTVLNDNIYTIGGASSRLTWGQSGQVVEVYHPLEDTWSRLQDLPFRICDQKAWPWENGIFILGGSSFDILDPNNDFTKLYTPTTGVIFDKAKMTNRRGAFASCYHDGKIFVFGGQTTGAEQGNRSAEVYDPAKNSWRAIRKMPESRYGHTAVSVNDKILIMGGIERFHLQKTVFEYDPRKDLWRRLPDLPESRAFLLAERVNGKLYVMGGTGYSRVVSKPANDLSFIRFRNNPFREFSLPSSSVKAIYEDTTGKLWIGTRTGLRILDRKSYRFSQPRFAGKKRPDLYDLPVRAICSKKDGKVLVVTGSSDLYEITGDRSGDVNPIEINKKFDVKTVIRDRSGLIWLGTAEHGLLNLIPDRNTFRYLHGKTGKRPALRHKKITSLCEDINGTLWIGTSAGMLGKYDQKKNTIEHIPFDSNHPILDICVGKTGELWLASGSVLTCFNPATNKYTDYLSQWLNTFSRLNFEFYSWIDELIKQDQLIVSIIRVGNDQKSSQSFQVDRKGDFLIVSHGEAILNNLHDRGWIIDKTSNVKVWEMEVYKSYIAGGAERNKIQISRITLDPGIYEVNYQSDAKHAFGQWLMRPPARPEWWGIMVFNLPGELPPVANSVLNTTRFGSNTLAIKNLSHVVEDKSGIIWCLINGSIYLFDRETKQFISRDILINGSAVRDINRIYMDRDATIWLGTDSRGLLMMMKSETGQIEPESSGYRHYQVSRHDVQSLTSNKITAIFQDGKGNLWVGTDLGLNRYIPGSEKFKRYATKEGLLSPSVSSIQEDRQGNIWISTIRGLSKLNPRTETIINYTQYDGLPLLPFKHSCLLSETGELYLGSDSGLIAFHPDSLWENTHIPPVVLTDFQISGVSVSPDAGSPVTAAISDCKEIHLSHDQNVLSFEFSALDFHYPEKNRYAYKLQGIDQSWIYSNATRRFITYSNLDPGEYTFLVKGSNNFGIWNNRGTAVNIHISPPWWRTWWFSFIAGIIVIGAIGLIYRSRIAHLNKLAHAQIEFSRKLIESQESERKRIASALHDSHGQNLLIISNELQRYQESDRITGKELLPLLETVKESIAEIRDISYNLHPHQLDRLGLRKAVDSMIRRIDRSAEATITSEIDDIDRLFDKKVQINIYRIIQEGINNIIKHSGATNAMISIKKTGRYVHIIFSDNGKGINYQEMKKNEGFGLAGMEERVKLLGGKFELRSKKGNGTLIQIILPHNASI